MEDIPHARPLKGSADMLMGQAREHLLRGLAREYMILGQAHAQMFMVQALAVCHMCHKFLASTRAIGARCPSCHASGCVISVTSPVVFAAMHAISSNKPFKGCAVPCHISAVTQCHHAMPCHNRPSHGPHSVPEHP